ncbi:hypothetical protein PM10SUCC1_21190 [Propionigenium maris DSM 9537]|uniref:HTH marR-type domain-containing protein n=1 Tax=Propionigenium maris DSM 9537 TaxID=1123000 RepID=A0A9W6GM03_9FUSO|nr:MarR family transcriptional regulator [Propionigenium maris]GLI56605.1 hypothetical protein PM10SUCC1_21190 [Propionigenium maris DSM 9537]
MYLNTLLNIEKDFYGYLKRDYGLSRTDIFIIMTSGRYDNMTAYSLASMTGFDRSLITKRLRYLEEKEFIIREDHLGKKIINLKEKASIVNRVLEKITLN